MKPALLSAVVLAAALAASPVLAQGKGGDADKPPDKVLTLGSGPATGATLTRAQLDECLAMPARLQVEADRAKRAAADAESDRAEFERFDDHLKAERAKVDPKNRQAIAAYNAKLEKREKMVAAYNAKSAAAGERVDAYNALRNRWESGCENRPYLQSDYAALRPVKSATAEEPPKTILRPVVPEGPSAAASK
jgi:hypothetical protein